MKIACKREALLEGVSIASSVAPSRSTRPILSGIKLSAMGGRVEALATDLDIAIRSRIREVLVEEEGEIVLTAQMLVEILRSIEGTEVTLHSSGRHCEIRSSDAEYKLVTDDAAEFPTLEWEGQGGITIPRAFLEEMYARTAFAAAREVGRYAINGVLVELGEGKIRFVATDGRRLAVATRPLPDASGPMEHAIIPVKGLHECLKGSEGCEWVRLQVSPGRVLFASEHTDIAVKPVDGEFPNYSSVIPQAHQGRVTIHRAALHAAIRKVAVMAGDEMRAVRIRISKDTIDVSAQMEGRGTAKTRIDAESEGASEFEVDFNPDFVNDFLKALPVETLRFEFRDSSGAGIFRLDGDDDLYVVMPITTS